MSKYDLDNEPTDTLNAEQKAFESGANDNVIARSLRGGMYGAGSQLLSAGAGAADALGADGVGAGLHKASRGLRDQAALPGNSPRVSSFKQLREAPSLDNVGEYMGGLVGGSLPTTALGIAGGVVGGRRGLLAGMAGAGAATTPLNVGEIVQRQQDDPEAMQQSAGSRFGDAVMGGVGASAIESVVPGLVGRQILGRGLGNLGKESVKQIVGRNALDIPMEGLAEGAGTAVKQFAANQSAPLDWEEIGEGAIGGAAAGSVFTGVGTAADLARMPGNRMGEALTSARTSIKDRLVAGKDAAQRARTGMQDAMPEMPKRVASLGEELGAMFQAGRGVAERAVESVRKGEALTDLKDLAGATPERIKEAMDLSDSQTLQRVTDWGTEMMNDAGLSPERRAQVAEAMANAGTRAGQATMAGLKKAWDVTQSTRSKLDKLRRSFKNRPVDVEASEIDTPRIGDGDVIDVESKKLSRDYSGANTAIAQKLRPLLSLRRQELIEDPADLDAVANEARQSVEDMGKGGLSSDTIFRLIDALGDDTAATLDAAFRTIGDPAKAEEFYQQLNEIADTQARSRQLNELVASSLTEQSRGLISDDQMGELVQKLVSHAKGERTDPRAGPAQRAAADRHFREQFALFFGDKADAVSLAIEKEAGMGGSRADKNDAAPSALDEDGNMKEAQDASFSDDTGERLSAEELDVIYVGAGKDERYIDMEQAEAMMHPDLFKSSKQPGMNRAQQAMNNAKERHSENGGDPRTVRFEYAEGSRTHGYVVAERSADPDGMTDAEVDAMRLDTKTRSKSPDRIEIPASEKTGGKPVILDSWRVAHAMHGKLERGALDDTSSRERMARMFMEGVARLTEKYGAAPVIADGVRIARLNGKDLTWGEAKQIGKTRRTERDRGSDRNTQQIIAARKELRTLTEGDDDRRLELESLIAEIEADREEAKAYEWGLRKSKRGRVTDIAMSNGSDELTGDPMAPDKAGNIHDAVRRIKGDDRPLFAGAEEEYGRGGRTGAELMSDTRDTRPNESLINKSNMDGSGHYVSDKSDFAETMRNVAGEMARMNTPAAKKIAAKLERLVRPHIMLSKTDKMRMASLAVDEVKFSRKAELVNELAEKYADAMRKRGPQKAGKPGDKKPVFDEHEVETESDDYSSSEPAFDSAPREEGPRAEPAALRTPVTMLEKAVAQRMKALTPQSAPAHGKWARATLDEGRARNESDTAALDALLAAVAEIEGGTPNPKARAARVAAPSAGEQTSLLRMQAEFPALELRSPTTQERAEIAEHVAALAEQLGDKMPKVEGIAIRDGEMSGFAGKAVTRDGQHHILLSKELFDSTTPFLNSTEAKVERALLHEVGHLVDREDGAFSDGSSSFAEGGRVFDELQALTGTHAEAADWYGYAFKAGLPHRELFAQAFAAFHFNPEALHDSAPKTHKFFSGYLGAGRRGEDGRAVDAGAAEARTEVDVRQAGAKDADEAYALTTKLSAQATNPAANVTGSYRQTVEAHVLKVLGPKVGVEWKNLTHAGEFQRMRLRDIIRISVHALDPMSVAYHESLHGFFAQLRDVGATDVMNVLDKAASSPLVIDQLKARFASQPAVLAQLKDPEERVAYMYQMWATDPSFRVAPSSKGALRRVADFIRKVLGIWSNDQKALHIMEYFHSGEYAKTQPSVAAAAMAAAGRNPALDNARELVKPMTRFADAVAATGSGRMRDTEIPALVRLADLIKREHTDERGGDQGFIQAARVERTKRLNELGNTLMGYEEATLAEAHEALISNTRAPSPEARLAVRAIKDLLAQTREYMVKAGVEVGDLGADYFPRVWDFHYISKNQQAFKDMLEPHVRSGAFKGNVDDFIRAMATRDGVEENVVSTQPGMQFKKERLLSFISPAEAAPFVDKELLGTLSKYVTQATRKAEWHRRLGDGKLEAIMEGAKKEGASKEDLELATNYMRGVDGTLGDTMNPHLRRITGNMIVYQNIRLLPLAVFSSIVDPVGIMVRGGTVGDAWTAFKRGIAEIPQSYGRAGKADSSSEAAELIGAIDSAMLTSVMGDIYTQGMVGGVAQKINTAFFKYNLMEGLNRSFRVGATEAAMKFVVRHHAGGTAHSARWMAELGLKAGDIKVMPDGRPALTAAEGLSAEQERRVHAALNQWVDGAVLRPDAADKPLWMNDPRWALVSHLKQFVYSFQKVILARVVHEIQQGNYTPLMALAAYVPVMIAADFAKGALQGGGDQPEWKKGWDMGDYLSHGVQRSGLLGVGQFGVDVSEDMSRGGSGLGALVGPTIEQFGDVVQMLGGQREAGSVILKSMPANALYAEYARNGGVDDGGAGRSE